LLPLDNTIGYGLANAQILGLWREGTTIRLHMQKVL
jgi:hypothetical protein